MIDANQAKYFLEILSKGIQEIRNNSSCNWFDSLFHNKWIWREVIRNRLVKCDTISEKCL